MCADTYEYIVCMHAYAAPEMLSLQKVRSLKGKNFQILFQLKY